ncbi:MAG: 16S rRNA (guanine(966)-N(2))-methyltransferase RsmD [Flavobacteriaceae bacterium]|jgi:16S rRNA (guanine(966)-N(2))-methyltransferase RsmD
MRIISGMHKGRKLTAPKTLSARPTTDVAKEGLFNVLSHRIDLGEQSVLDLFSGTGNISFEFCSRGSRQVTAVEQDRQACGFIRKTAELLSLETLEIRCAKVESFLQSTAKAYDIVFMDPPYSIGVTGYAKLIALVFNQNWISEDGILIAEHSSKDILSAVTHFAESRSYGSSSFSFFQK